MLSDFGFKLNRDILKLRSSRSSGMLFYINQLTITTDYNVDVV